MELNNYAYESWIILYLIDRLEFVIVSRSANYEHPESVVSVVLNGAS